MTMTADTTEARYAPDTLDALDARIITRLQDGLPLTPRPFAEAAKWFGLTEEGLLTRMRRLKEDGVVMRIGPLINADVAGGAYLLAALAVPPQRFDEVTAIVNSFDEVAHNYRRDHAFNMWFVIAAESQARIAETVRAIEGATGLSVLQLPKETEYFVDFRVRLSDDEPPEETAVPPALPASCRPCHLDEADRRLLALMQPGLPLTPHPWRALAEQLDMSENDVLARTRRLLAAGVIRRLALVPNHYRLGLKANGMSVWDVDDGRIDELGHKIGTLPFVSHCYRRPRRPGWPYNLFAMVHGRTRAEALAHADAIAEVLGDAARRHDVLFSTRILKKTGTRLFRAEKPERQQEQA